MIYPKTSMLVSLLNFVCFRIEISVLLCIVVCDLEHDK